MKETSLNCDLRFVVPQDADLPPCLFHCPPDLPAGAPVAVCVHGYNRQPLDLAQAFLPLARAHGMAMLLPVFGERRHRRYQQLLHARKGVRSDLALLSVVDGLARRHGLDASRLYLFGFSGGAQFVHRFAMLHAGRTAALALGAAGWYTWPDIRWTYPVGLGGTDELLGRAVDLTEFLRCPIRVWVGTRDEKVDGHVRSDPEIDSLQGPHRMERGRRWVDALQAVARARGVPADVKFEALPNVGHDFLRCAQRGDLAQRAMDFFTAHRDARGGSRPG